MKSLIIVIFSIINTTCLFASFVNVPSNLKRAAQKIETFSESRHLLKEIEKEGLIKLEFRPLGKGPFHACWIGEIRTILLNSSNSWTEGQIISSILFELHNAKQDKAYDRLNTLALKRQITKDQYVETIEHLEFDNSIMTKNLIDAGIKNGYYPKDANLLVYKNFEEHFYWQLKLGHSALMARQYDDLVIEGLQTSHKT
jgi:hypothetical protein